MHVIENVALEIVRLVSNLVISNCLVKIINVLQDVIHQDVILAIKQKKYLVIVVILDILFLAVWNV